MTIRLLSLPTVSGPTSGGSLAEEFTEWRLQARRWTVGAAEVFHYYVVKFLGREFDLACGVSYGLSFLLYYGFIMCGAALFQLCAAWGVTMNGCMSELDYEFGDSAFPYVSPAMLFGGLILVK